MYTQQNTSFAHPSIDENNARLIAAAARGAARSARRCTRARAALALAVAAATQLEIGCGDGSLTPDVLLIDHTTSALSLGSVNALNGTYGNGCIGRSGAWSTAIGGFSGSLGNAQLSVVKGNSSCVLTLTSILIGSNTYLPESTVTLTDSYTQSAVAYKQDMMTAVAFYGNLKLSDATFTSSFSISMMYSDDSGLASAGSAQSTYKYNSIGATQSGVEPSDYTVDGSGVSVQTDAQQVISNVAGSIALTDGQVTGQDYVVSSVDLGSAPSFDDIDAAYSAGTPVAITGADPQVAASALQLVGASLASGSIKREVIVAHIVNDIRAYQVITLTVLAPQ